jgi:hypothetical protein
MIVGLLKIWLNLHGIGSLKEKRSIVKSVVGRVKSRYNFSIAEVEAHDSKMQAVLGLGVVANDTAFVNKQMDTVINFITADGRFYVGRIEREIFPFNE